MIAVSLVFDSIELAPVGVAHTRRALILQRVFALVPSNTLVGLASQSWQ